MVQLKDEPIRRLGVLSKSQTILTLNEQLRGLMVVGGMDGG